MIPVFSNEEAKTKNTEISWDDVFKPKKEQGSSITDTGSVKHHWTNSDIVSEKCSVSCGRELL